MLELSDACVCVFQHDIIVAAVYMTALMLFLCLYLWLLLYSKAEQLRVVIGASSSRTKCVTVEVPVVCAADAANRGKRVNTDYADADDTFEITTEGPEVCARRIGGDSDSWGMQLEILCLREAVTQVMRSCFHVVSTCCRCMLVQVTHCM